MDKKKEIDMTLVNLTRHKIRQEEQKKGKHLTRRQRKNIMFYTSIGLYIFSGVLGGKAALALNEANESAKTEVTVDATNKNEINIKNVDFKSGLSVNIDYYKAEPNEITINENIMKNVENQIDDVASSKDVLNIAKRLYVEEYNKTHEGKNININCVELYSTTERYGINKKKAKNGDTIYTLSDNNKSGEEIFEARVYDRDINDVGAQIIRSEYTAHGEEGGFATVYDEDAEVEKYEDNILAKMGYILDIVISYYKYLGSQGMVGSDISEKYKYALKIELMNYKQKEIEQESIQYLADDREMEK